MEAAQALGQLAQHKPDQPGAAPALAALEAAFTGKDGRPRRCAQAVASALAGNHSGSAWLLGLEQKKRLPDDVRQRRGPAAAQQPLSATCKTRRWSLFPPPPKMDPKKLPPIAVLAKRVGDAVKGKALLAASAKNDMQCLKCHTIRGAGGQVGPDLSMIGKKASRENLYESILLPSKAIADQYLQWKIDKNDGLSDQRPHRRGNADLDHAARRQRQGHENRQKGHRYADEAGRVADAGEHRRRT